MIATFFDRQKEDNPLNGSLLESQAAVEGLLNGLRDRDPFFWELISENGKVLLIGIGNDYGTVQYSSKDGSPPYLMAMNTRGVQSDKTFEFLMGDTLTPVPACYILPLDRIVAIIHYFLSTGLPAPTTQWEEI